MRNHEEIYQVFGATEKAKMHGRQKIMQTTSLEAYYTKVLPWLAESQARVYTVLCEATERGFDMTNREIAALLKWDINRVTPRMLELRRMGLLVRCGKRKCGVTGNTAWSWRVRT